MFEINEKSNVENKGARIRVIGVGGGGGNAVNTMIEAKLAGVEYIAVNTDAQALEVNQSSIKVQIGKDITKGLGAGANPEVGRRAAIEEYERLSEIIEGADMVFITAGMGGGTGTGAGPVIAKMAKELGALTVGVVTKPFMFEGKKRGRQANIGIESLEEAVDSLITIPNQRLLYLAGEDLSLIDTFKKADEILLNAVQGISDLINNTGLINADFADVNTVMQNQGLALMGTGVGSGEDRAIKAATEAINSPLLEDVSINGATGIIINITGDKSLTTHETNEAVSLIMEAAHEEAEIIFGTVIDEDMGECLKITVVATGIGGNRRVVGKNNEKVTYGELNDLDNEIKNFEEDNNSLNLSNVNDEQLSFENLKIDQESEEFVKDEVESKEIAEDDIENLEQKHDLLDDEKTAENSGLIESIKRAALNYGNKKKESNDLSDNDTLYYQNENTEENDEKARDIAERLGFIGFEEDEYDTPTFLRKNKNLEEEENLNLKDVT